MIDGLKPYAERKFTSSRWLKEVPSHWGIQSLRTLVKPRAERNRPELPLLSVAREKGVFVRSLTDPNENHNVIPEDLRNYKVARQGNLVINKMKAWQGSMGIAPCDGIVSPAYFVFDLSVSNARFAQAMFRSKPYVAHFAQASDGVRVGQWDLSIPGMREIPVLLPPPDEQAAIVKFLDYANGKIERAIRAKRKLVGLLNEQKQAIIHRAVTRGLDPNVKLKPSGIPWLGDVPEHWEVRALKRVVAAKITDGPHETPQLLDDGIDFISAESMVNGQFVFERRRGFISRELHEQYCIKCRPKRDDVFMCKSGATTGKVAIVETDKEFSVWSPLALLRANNRVVLPRFLFVVLQTQYVQQQVKEKWSFGTQQNLSMGGMGRILIAVPTIPEQLDAIERIGQRSAPLNTTIARLEREIDLLREYRTTLTAEVVTGKLDVREAAKRLPDQADEPLPPDESLDDLVDEEIAEEVET
jgi:type I restriction enzyme S subunit